MKLTPKNRMGWFKKPRRRGVAGGFVTGCNTGLMRHARCKGETGKRTRPVIQPATQAVSDAWQLIELVRSGKLAAMFTK